MPLEYAAVKAARSGRLKHRMFELLEAARDGDNASRHMDVAIMVLIGANLGALILETVPAIGQRFGTWFSAFEIVSVAIFTIEYIARLWSCTVDARYADPIRGRLRFAAKPLALIDAAAILPFYLPFFGIDLRFLRAARLFRLFRVAKLVRYSDSLRIIGRVLAAKKEQLVVVTAVIGFLILVSSSLMYFAEHPGQPDAFSSIPAAMWWAVATLSTVGYGDVYPITALGKLCASVVAVLGIGMFALPAGILGSGFVDEMDNRNSGIAELAPGMCPHCRQPLPGHYESAGS